MLSKLNPPLPSCLTASLEVEEHQSLLMECRIHNDDKLIVDDMKIKIQLNIAIFK